MKTTCLSLAFCCYTLLIHAQNWELYTASRTLNLHTAAKGLIGKSLYTGKTLLRGADTVFIMQPRAYHSLLRYPYLAPVGNTLADSVFRRANGVYECRYIFNPDASGYLQSAFLIYTHAEVGQSWIFRDTLRARVLSKTAALNFGRADSVKTILIGKSDTLRLSKHFGLLQWKNESLAGWQNTQVGQQLPNGHTWYGWQAGDVFEYRSAFSSPKSHTTRTDTWKKWYVLSRQMRNDSLIFAVRSLSKIINWKVGVGEQPPIYRDTIIKVRFGPLKSVIRPGTLNNGSGLEQCSYAYKDGLLHRYHNSVSTPASSGRQFRSVMAEGLGEIESSYAFAIDYYSQTFSESLIAYQKVGQQPIGDLNPDSFYKVIVNTSNPGELVQITAYPNPAQDFVRLHCVNCQEIYSAELYNLQGQKLLSSSKLGREGQLDLSRLAAGCYLLRVETALGQALKKILVN
jgi:Secretion system C-terminal sorting domain